MKWQNRIAQGFSQAKALGYSVRPFHGQNLGCPMNHRPQITNHFSPLTFRFSLPTLPSPQHIHLIPSGRTHYVMPRGANPKREREYKEIEKKFEKEGRYKGREKEVAARIVNKQRAKAGEAKETASTKRKQPKKKR
jgi:hypothetical protein